MAPEISRKRGTFVGHARLGFLRLSACIAGVSAVLLAGLSAGACGSSPAENHNSSSSGSSGGGSSSSSGGYVSEWDGGAFTHPGVLGTTEQLDFVKTQIAAGKPPWTGALAAAKADTHAQLTYPPTTPPATINCGPKSTGPDAPFCQAEQDDSLAAYADAIIWYLTGDAMYAQKSIQIMDTWSAIFTSHGKLFDPQASNQFVQSGWTGQDWAAAAELIKYTYTMNGGWPNAARFATMLKTSHLPYVTSDGGRMPFVGSTMTNPLEPNGNWESEMIGAAMHIAVFLDDKDAFARALYMWRTRVPAYMYLLSEGPFPNPPPLVDAGMPYNQMQLDTYWGGNSFPMDFPVPNPDGNGMGQETCRDGTDMHHLEWGYSSLIGAAETAHIQGVDLYGEQRDRFVAAFEFSAKYLNGATVPSWLCPGMGLHVMTIGKTYVIGYNHYANRLGIPMPNTKTLLAQIEPTGASHNVVFETLTHHGVP
jgi:hypothetical protein